MNIQDPTQLALATLVASFLFYALVLYLIKPNWVQIIDRKGGKLLLSRPLLVTYAMTFASITAIFALIMASKHFSTNLPPTPNLMPYSTN